MEKGIADSGRKTRIGEHVQIYTKDRTVRQTFLRVLGAMATALRGHDCGQQPKPAPHYPTNNNPPTSLPTSIFPKTLAIPDSKPNTPCMATPHRKTIHRFDTPGDVHFLTFSCFRRLPLLSRTRTRQYCLDALEVSREKNGFDLWAFVIMPEHVHLIVLPHAGVKVAPILSTIKQSVAKRAIFWLQQNAPQFLSRIEDLQPNGNRSYRFWQRGPGYDRNLRSARDVHEKIRYIHENPVRRHLVERPEQWPWSSCAAWESGSNEPIPLDRANVPALTNLDDSITSDYWR
ncbi:transposase [Blastopirellula sp. JC732]|uniref:Transposase n=1 Tax=Blastopirellula sediminis TaxID=2894196 RepID=A0A9X1MJU3_9BACT|nr:transposase [Blastopirellula sediminis]MCC9607712.1 transposase [Blastopirellula sediminis]MCC9627495.1 transposase [Blastopirellula sediminis]